MADGEPGADPGPDIARLDFAHHRAYLIGIDAYQNVAPLKTAVNDATRLAELLATQHRPFEVQTLLDATGAQLRALLATMAQQVGANDRVVFYFAGHGIAADGDDGPAGYIVPADAERAELGTFVPMSELQAALDALKCRHLLLILDCCFSGAFKWSSRHRAFTGLMPKRIYAERFDRFVKDPARQIITSAAYDQKALDVLDGKATGERGAVTADDGRAHSPFALALFDALAGAADVKLDREGDGVITATEMYAYIRDRIEPATIAAGERLRQTPSFFPLPGHGKGEFMFLHPRHRLNLPRSPRQSPFKGLASFDEKDRHLFYGRDRVVAELAAKAADPAQRLLVVVGASGTGKSSVVKAGLLPQLRDAGLAVLLMRPGAQPVVALDEVLKTASGAAVLIIDQFEEVITRCADPALRLAFDARLRALLDAGDQVSRIVITVRSDFEPQVNGGALKEPWLTGRFTVPPFSLDELREVIVLPTVQEVLIFDPPELVDQIIGEVVQSPGALPLLSYTLNELYEAYVRGGRSDRALTQADYEQLGGVMGALRTKADALHDALAGDTERDTMRRIMLRMVSMEGDLAGRRVPIADLVYPQVDQTVVNMVIERLVDARLIVKNQDAIEPAHDALVRAWKTLRDWIHQAGRDKLILGEQLQIAARDHARSGDAEYLWNNNPNLPAMQALLKEPGRCWFNTREVEFIGASVRRKTRRLRIAVGVTAAVLATVSALGIWGWVEQTHATGSITAARGFTDNLLADLMKKLRAIAKTQNVRKDLVQQVRGLHETLVSNVGAKQDPNTRFWTRLLEGEAELENKQFNAAQASYEQAIQVAGQQPPASAYWQRNLSIAQGQLGDLAKADEGKPADFDEARRRYLLALAIDTALVARAGSGQVALHDQFVSEFRLGDLERRHAQAATPEQGAAFAKERRREARKRFVAALVIAERLKNEHPGDAEAKRDYAMTLVELGNSAMDLGQRATDDHGRRARDEFHAAVQWAERWPDEVAKHPDMKAMLGLAYGRLGFLQAAFGQLDEAREAIHKALDISLRPPAPGAKPNAPPDAEQQADRYANYTTLGEVEVKSHDPAAARLAYANALRIAEEEIAAGRQAENWKYSAFDTLLKLAEVEVDAGQKKAARLAFQRALKAAPADEKRLAAECLKALRSPCRPPA